MFGSYRTFPFVRLSGLIVASLLLHGLAGHAEEIDPFAPVNQYAAEPAGGGAAVDPFDAKFAFTERDLPQPLPKEGEPKGNEKSVGATKKSAAKTEGKEKVRDIVSLSVKVEPQEVPRGGFAKITIHGNVKEGWHIFPITQKAPGQTALTKLTYKLDEGLRPVWPVTESKSEFHKAPDGSIQLEHRGAFTWSQEIYVSPEATPGTKTIAVSPFVQACNESRCLVPEKLGPLMTSIRVKDDAPLAATAEVKKKLETHEPEPLVITPAANLTRDGTNSKGADQGGLVGLLVSAFLGALLMLFTPCVFPMIPITVNFFLKQSEKEHHNPLLTAIVYSGTIIILLSAAILVFGNLVVVLANNAWFNLILGGFLIFFALSLFGMYEIELPSGLARYTSAHEGQGGYVGAVFMALTFTITSFTCTGPFLGAMMAPVAQIRPPFWHLALAAVVYSATFAAPFFLLALFPTLLRALPKSGGWLNSVKVTMGFLELAAALKFLANTDLALNPGNPLVFNYDTVLCAWVAIAVACGLYLFGAFRLPHDDSADRIGVVRMLIAAVFLGLAVYMTPLLFGIKPAGIVADGIVAFLPPSFREETTLGGGGGEQAHLSWHLDYEDAWKEAMKDNRLIFIDFTGVNCTNCRANEKNVFTRKEVRDELRNYARVALYVDNVPKKGIGSAEAKTLADRNLALQTDLLGDVSLPTYVVFRPHGKEPFKDGKLNGEVIDTRKDLIRDVNDFIQFLKTPLERGNLAREKRDQGNPVVQVGRGSEPARSGNAVE